MTETTESLDLPRPPLEDGRVRCATCATPYLPKLTAGTCPVCDTPAPDSVGASRLPRWFSDPDDRMIAIVVVATVLNVALLTLLAVLVLND
jgi:hypothetical protein